VSLLFKNGGKAKIYIKIELLKFIQKIRDLEKEIKNLRVPTQKIKNAENKL